MSQNNGNKKDPELKNAELSGDFTVKRYQKAQIVYYRRNQAVLKRDCRDDLIEAQEQFLLGLANTLDQYQKRFGDIEVLQEKPYLEKGGADK